MLIASSLSWSENTWYSLSSVEGRLELEMFSTLPLLMCTRSSDTACLDLKEGSETEFLVLNDYGVKKSKCCMFLRPLTLLHVINACK